jgi:hypothetical protein
MLLAEAKLARNDRRIALVIIVTIVNYDRKTFIEQATLLSAHNWSI